jgi:nucleoside phosphorylase
VALKPYFVSRHLSSLAPTPSRRKYVEAVLALMAPPEFRANVADIHRGIFELSTTASANAALNRLIREVNEAAAANGVAITMCITAAKKRPDKRWVWFEGPDGVTPRAATGEFDSIPAARLVPDQRGLPADLLPVVMLFTYNEHETAAVLARFHPDGSPRTETRAGITYNLLGVHSDMRVVHRVSRQGQAESQQAANDAIASWAPCAMIGVGIAFGMNAAKQAVGDVLVSARVRDYELARVGEITLYRGDGPPASQVLLQRFNHLDQTRRADPALRLEWPEVRIGPILTGNKLIDDVDYRDSLLALEPEAVGGEMEALGLQKVCDRHHVDWIVVKAICDWADGNKDSPRKAYDQRFAADKRRHQAQIMLPPHAIAN